MVFDNFTLSAAAVALAVIAFFFASLCCTKRS